MVDEFIKKLPRHTKRQLSILELDALKLNKCWYLHTELNVVANSFNKQSAILEGKKHPYRRMDFWYSLMN